MEFISGNVFIRPLQGREGMQSGEVVSGHTHNFDHTSMFFNGLWRIRKWKRAVDAAGILLMQGDEEVWLLDKEIERQAPFWILIEAQAKHEITYLGNPVSQWMEPFLAKLSDEDATMFRAEHEKGFGKAWCVYSHRNPQGDITQHYDGWLEATT